MILDESTYEDILHHLPVEARIVLRCYTEQFRTEEVAEEQIMIYLQNKTVFSGLKCLLALEKLEAAELLIKQITLSDQYMYRMPLTVYFYLQKKWQPSDIGYATDAMVEQMWSDGELYPAAKPLSAQLFVFLAAVGKSKAAVHHKKQFSKKWMEQVAARCHLTEEILIQTGVNRKGVASLLADLLLNLSLQLKVVQLVNNKLEWHDTTFIKWLRMNGIERENQLQLLLFEWLLDHSAINSHQLACFANLEVDRWAVTTNAAWHPLLELLHAVGVIEVVGTATNTTSGHSYYFRKNEINHSGAEQIILQENGDMMIDRHHYWLRWELELVAECVREEEWATYRFSASSLAAAVEQGRSKDGVLTFLQQYGTTVPGILAVMLQQWMPASSSPYVMQTLLLDCQSSDLADRIEQLAREQQLQLQRIGAQHFALEEQHLATVRNWLQQLEHPLKKRTTDDSPAVVTYPNYQLMMEDVELEAGAVALPELEIDVMLRQMQPETMLQTALEELEQLPRQWTEKLQTYHPSTRKQIIAQAIKCRVEVLLRVDNSLVTFVPQSIVEQASGWEVIGCYGAEAESDEQYIERRVIKLADDAWQAIQIVKPIL